MSQKLAFLASDADVARDAHARLGADVWIR
jgi:hypothetical protein